MITKNWTYTAVKQKRVAVIAKETRIAEMVAALSRTDPRGVEARDLRRKLAKARSQLQLMQS